MKVLYLSRPKLERSLNSVCIKGLQQNGVEVVGFYSAKKGFLVYFDAVRFLIKEKNNADAFVVGYDSPGFVILIWLISKKKIIYNAVLSVYERLIVSRELASKFSIKAFYYWLLDFVAVRLANLTVVETNHQADYFKKMFKISDKKISRNWIGVDEDKFFYDSAVTKRDVFTVLFRGAFMPEAGVEYAINAAKMFEDKNIKFIIIGGGILLEKTKELISELKPKNLELITYFLPYEKLRQIMQGCHLSLGQLSDHDRLTRTIPHKAYESLAMKLPYLTASNTGILELLTPDKTCLTCNPADSNSLAEKILLAKNNYPLAADIAENGYQLYQDKLKSYILAKNLLDRVTCI